MPFRSEKQKKFMYSQHPDIAKKWAKKYGNKIHQTEALKRKLKK